MPLTSDAVTEQSKWSAQDSGLQQNDWFRRLSEARRATLQDVFWEICMSCKSSK